MLIGTLILTACNNSETQVIEDKKITSVLPFVQDVENKEVENKLISPPDLETEKGVKEYLIGEWECNIEYMSNIIANMVIHEDLDFELSFYDSFTKEAKGDYKGNIIFKRIYRNQDDPPDMISLELDGNEFMDCDYYFFHRTIYDGKRVMSLFFAGANESIFDILGGNDDWDYVIPEIMLEKKTNEVTQGKPRKNDEFNAVFWGHGVHGESIWLDDVEWTPREEYDDPNYPVPIIVHENAELESVLYNIDQCKEFNVLGDDMFKGTAYYVETDEQGNVVRIIDAEYKNFIEERSEEYMAEIQDEIFSIIEDIDEIQENFEYGMSFLFTGESTIIDGEECYEFALGTNHEEHFVREMHYAVDLITRKVYEYNVLDDIWEEK